MTISAQVIDTIVEWIDDNLHQPLRIEEIARHAGYSKWHLQRLFMQYKGESLGRYIRERKLLMAARDLRESDERVYDICLRYGFDSQQTFTRIFTRTFNQPPGRTAKKITVGRTENILTPALSPKGEGVIVPLPMGRGLGEDQTAPCLPAVIHRRRHRPANPVEARRIACARRHILCVCHVIDVELRACPFQAAVHLASRSAASRHTDPPMAP